MSAVLRDRRVAILAAEVGVLSGRHASRTERAAS